MCGIAGFNWRDEALGQKMNECLAHRGPDSEGIYSNENVTLVHKRLAIIDLSSGGHQPMWDRAKECVIVFNGEIYNYQELRKELAPNYDFHTQSDTEVILAGYKVWGKEVVERLNGIFAFTIWDNRAETLFSARDHMGIKPFYYYWDGAKFIFASEVKAILAHDIPRELDLDSFNQYLRVLYVPEPNTMIKDVFKLPPGSWLTLRASKLEVRKYYEPILKTKDRSYETAKQEVHDTVVKAVERQLVADVPVGVYLSGGIDSSTILSAVSKVKQGAKTFSVGFDLHEGEEGEKFNRDFELAAETSKFFGAEHHPLTISARDVAESMEHIIGDLDDPISNPTAIPMAHLSKFAKQHVTVALSGNGGDELFGGYERYQMSRRVDFIGKIPLAKYFLPSRIRGALEMSGLDRLVQFEFEKDKRLTKVLNRNYFKGVDTVKSRFAKYAVGVKDKTEALIQADLTSWLPDQALALGDRMSMLGSLEERVPFLDRKVVDLAQSLPLSYKVTPFKTKKILKDAFRSDLPGILFQEAKRGWFSPGAKWLRRTEIQKVVREVLSEKYYAPTKDLFDWSAIQTMLDKHIDKSEYNLTILWAIITFQIWAKHYKIEALYE